MSSRVCPIQRLRPPPLALSRGKFHQAAATLAQKSSQMWPALIVAGSMMIVLSPEAWTSGLDVSPGGRRGDADNGEVRSARCCREGPCLSLSESEFMISDPV